MLTDKRPSNRRTARQMNRGPGAEPRNKKYSLMYMTGQNAELSSAEITNDTGVCMCITLLYTQSDKSSPGGPAEQCFLWFAELTAISPIRKKAWKAKRYIAGINILW